MVKNNLRYCFVFACHFFQFSRVRQRVSVIVSSRASCSSFKYQFPDFHNSPCCGIFSGFFYNKMIIAMAAIWSQMQYRLPDGSSFPIFVAKLPGHLPCCLLVIPVSISSKNKVSYPPARGDCFQANANAESSLPPLTTLARRYLSSRWLRRNRRKTSSSRRGLWNPFFHFHRPVHLIEIQTEEL